MFEDDGTGRSKLFRDAADLIAAQAAQIVASVGVPPIAASVSAEPKPELTGKDRFLATIKIDTK
jgi:hypothetical protein